VFDTHSETILKSRQYTPDEQTDEESTQCGFLKPIKGLHSLATN